ncbi:MAG: hypothetical protein NVS2B16_28390 [Chloroflexota bacterium]
MGFAAALALIARASGFVSPLAAFVVLYVASSSFAESARAAVRALRDGNVVRWLVVLEATNLLGDVPAGFLPMYFVDVSRVSVADAAIALILWSVAGLLGDALLVPLLGLISGVVYLLFSALVALVIYPAFLIVPGLLPKLVFLSILGAVHAGWYAVPQAGLFSELRGHSGVAFAVSNVAGLPIHALPLLLGVLAHHVGLGVALRLCLLAPLSLLAGISKGHSDLQPVESQG